MKPEWEDEFTKLVTGTTPDKASIPPQWIDFIQNLLTSQRESILKQFQEYADKYELEDVRRTVEEIRELYDNIRS